MSPNFLPCERDQQLLMPTDLREWLPEDHLAWFVLDTVAELDLEPFYRAYRADGWGRAAHDPEMMVALMLYAYASGERSARRIERRCQEDVAYRVITANRAPDHATIARFRARHAEKLAELFAQILGLCARAGLVSVGTIALDGTRILANAADRPTAPTHSSPGRSSRRPPGSTPRRTSASATHAATSCLRSWRTPRPGGSACARRSAAWTRSTPPSRPRWPPGHEPRPNTPPAPD